MKYAAFIASDQTIEYLSDVDRGYFTIRHPEALLFASKQEANAAMDAVHACWHHGPEWERLSADEQERRRTNRFIECVEDEAEFRGRENTW